MIHNNCNQGCCTYKITPYKEIKWNNGDGWKTNTALYIQNIESNVTFF